MSSRIALDTCYRAAGTFRLPPKKCSAVQTWPIPLKSTPRPTLKKIDFYSLKLCKWMFKWFCPMVNEPQPFAMFQKDFRAEKCPTMVSFFFWSTREAAAQTSATNSSFTNDQQRRKTPLSFFTGARLRLPAGCWPTQHRYPWTGYDAKAALT